MISINTREQLAEFLNAMKHEQRQLRKHCAEILWYMRGSISREEVWTLSVEEQKDYMDLINEKIKFVEKTKMPIL